MIKWEEIKGLHVITKLDEILSKWFGVEQFYIDSHYKIRSNQLEKDYEIKNHFFKVQMGLNHGYDFLTQDIEKNL